MDLKLPELGENIEEATVLSILVSKGDRVEKDQSVLEVETDKASLEVPAAEAGTVTAISVSEGDSIKVGQTFLQLEPATRDEKDEAQEAEDSDEESQRTEASSSEDKAPRKEDRKPSDRETETEKEDEKVQSKEDDESAPKDKTREKESKAEKQKEPVRGGIPVFASPSVRAFAREIGVPIGRVAGSGPGGRISVDDVKRHAREQRADGGSGAGDVQAGPLPDFGRWGEIERSEMTAFRRAVAEQMRRSWAVVPHVTLFEKADATALEEARQRFRKRLESQGDAKLTLTALLLKLVAASLQAHPNMRASVDLAENQIIHKRYTHLGVAVDTPRGLVVPVLRDVDRKTLAEVTKDLDELARKARDGKLRQEDVQGGVFTLTNLGGLGTEHFTPIVNYPEGTILGVGRATMEPVYAPESETFVPRLRLPLSLSFDHRLVDGADGARFLHGLVTAIEDPYLVALDAWERAE